MNENVEEEGEKKHSDTEAVASVKAFSSLHSFACRICILVEQPLRCASGENKLAAGTAGKVPHE